MNGDFQARKDPELMRALQLLEKHLTVGSNVEERRFQRRVKHSKTNAGFQPLGSYFPPEFHPLLSPQISSLTKPRNLLRMMPSMN